jgi:hypothetical protein
MVDFANSNLCGASAEMNDVFKKLDQAAADIESKIDEAASTAAAAFASAQTELNSLTAKLQSIEIPQLPKLNLQAEIKALSELVPGTPAYLSSLATITKEFGADLAAAGKDLDSLISSGLSAITSGGNICNVVPNIEKEAGSINPATEKAINVLQAAVAPLTETVSTVTQNASITEQTEEIEVDVAAAQTPLKTETTPLEEDAGAYSMVPEEQVKTISTAVGETKVVSKKVEKAEDRKNVAPKSKSDGFTHRISREELIVKKSDILFSSGVPDSDGLYTVQVELSHTPAFRPSITQYNLADNDVRTVKDIQGTAYRESYGIHGEILDIHPNIKGIPNRGITMEGKVITFKTPYFPLGDHEGDLTSITYTVRGNKKKPFAKTKAGSKRRNGTVTGRLISDKRYNKLFKGRQFKITYMYRDNYDPEVET